MKNIEQLREIYFKAQVGEAHWQDYINWAIDRLRCDDEGDDLDIVMLAAATLPDEVQLLVVQIAERYLGDDALNDELVAGKWIVELHRAYKSGKETAISIEPKLWRRYYDLAMPDWLMMLARNCEYATDVPDFQGPFDEEFDYIAGLWDGSRSLLDFMSQYDSAISRSHDVQYE
ncbi:hypothetical protein DK842_01050 [Chromobacterium phragmitis]|uniref:hypothetical protein n=1 Tax=Chromobacterium phragmitis TaxID=2202141 RepID=UPI000DEC158F|nr:hypothetical protein [Chromobacterium phragmitis]AXE28624.1 hypothetical protein DK842_01050 [Chromobacterium phragmitis]